MKTKEDKGAQYSKSIIDSFETEGVPCGIKDIQRMIADGFIAGVNHIMSLPLAERLTPLERGRVQTLYLSANCRLQTRLDANCYNQISELDNEYQKGLNMGIVVALKHIFGKEMFELKGGKQ